MHVKIYNLSWFPKGITFITWWPKRCLCTCHRLFLKFQIGFLYNVFHFWLGNILLFLIIECISYDIVYNLYDDYICILIFAIFELKVFSCTLVYFISDTVFISHVYMRISNWEYHFLIVIYSLNILSFFDWKFLEISNFICIQIKNIFHVFHFPHRIKEVRVMRCATCISFLNILKQIRRQINVSGAQSSLL